ncbi:hypothetical protein, partial [Mesorhizobium sp.]|uniref:hypothetical protein n=1 Tax=Mesorhizobium sp. TaxID=1871066 RepID=UPI0025CEA5F4
MSDRAAVYLFVFAQFRTEGYGEVAEPDRFTLLLELLQLYFAVIGAEDDARQTGRTRPCSTCSACLPVSAALRQRPCR